MRISASRLRSLIREIAETAQTEQEPRSSKDAAFHSLMDRTAVYVESAKGQVRSAVIYDTEHGKRPYDLSKDDVLYDVIKGVIDISKPVSKPNRYEMPCLGAWEVISSAGPKYGKMVYGVGYALSPNGILMPDRSSVSADARGGWTTSFSRGETVGQLDDWQNPKTPEPEDDCWVHNEDGAPYLDYAYSVGPERSVEIFGKLEANHKSYMERLGDYDAKTFIRKLNKHSQKFFEMHT